MAIHILCELLNRLLVRTELDLVAAFYHQSFMSVQCTRTSPSHTHTFIYTYLHSHTQILAFTQTRETLEIQGQYYKFVIPRKRVEVTSCLKKHTGSTDA